MARSKVPPDHEYDDNGICKYCGHEYPKPPLDPKPGDFDKGDVPAPTVTPAHD